MLHNIDALSGKRKQYSSTSKLQTISSNISIIVDQQKKVYEYITQRCRKIQLLIFFSCSLTAAWVTKKSYKYGYRTKEYFPCPLRGAAFKKSVPHFS